MSRPFTPKPMPRFGTLRDLAEGIAYAFQQLSPEDQERFRRESMRKTYHDLSAAAWNAEHQTRPYDLERVN